jgi:NAD(P)-dependent dehydrogenase (short-subunit alcohol dehydrogenase family)
MDLEVAHSPTQLLVHRLDVTKVAEIKTVFDAARTHFGRLDVVVNNAGYGILAEIEATPDEDARQNFEVQFWGPVNITREVRHFSVLIRVDPNTATGHKISARCKPCRTWRSDHQY